MRHLRRICFGVPALCLLVALEGCRTPQPAPVKTAGLTIEVRSAKASRRGVDVAVRITNEHDLNINFELGDVRLIVDPVADKQVSPANPRGNVQRLEVQSKGYREFRWNFPLDEVLAPGTYTIEIKSFRELDMEYPNKAVFQINV